MNILHARSLAHVASLRRETMSPCGLTAGSRATAPLRAMDAANKSQHDGFCTPFFSTTPVRAFVAIVFPLSLHGSIPALRECGQEAPARATQARIIMPSLRFPQPLQFLLDPVKIRLQFQRSLQIRDRFFLFPRLHSRLSATGIGNGAVRLKLDCHVEVRDRLF